MQKSKSIYIYSGWVYSEQSNTKNLATNYISLHNPFICVKTFSCFEPFSEIASLKQKFLA